MGRHVHGGHEALPGDSERVPALGEDLHQILHDASERLEADRDISMRRCAHEHGGQRAVRDCNEGCAAAAR